MFQYLERFLTCMEEHPRIRQARVRLNPPPTERVATLGKDVPSWQEVEEKHADEVEGGRRMSQRNKEKEGKSAINNYIVSRTPDPCQEIFCGGGPARDARGLAEGGPREEVPDRPGTVSYIY